jgi:hypothetical protein
LSSCGGSIGLIFYFDHGSEDRGIEVVATVAAVAVVGIAAAIYRKLAVL